LDDGASGIDLELAQRGSRQSFFGLEVVEANSLRPNFLRIVVVGDKGLGATHSHIAASSRRKANLARTLADNLSGFKFGFGDSLCS